MKDSERTPRVETGDGETKGFRFSESLSRKRTDTMCFEKANKRGHMRIGYVRVSTDKQSLDL